MVWCAEGHQIIYNAYDSQQKFLQERCIEFLSPITQYYKSVDLQIEKPFVFRFLSYISISSYLLTRITGEKKIYLMRKENNSTYVHSTPPRLVLPFQCCEV